MSEQETFNTLTAIRYKYMLKAWAKKIDIKAYKQLTKPTEVELEDFIIDRDGDLIPMLNYFNINMELPKNVRP